MVTRQDIQRLLQHAPNGNAVLSLYLDMSVTSENKRTYHVFLQQQRLQHSELDSDRGNHHREPLGAALERIDRWIESSFDPSNRGLAFFTELGGDWFEVVQVPLALQNKCTIADRPVIGPLAELISKNRSYGVALVDREHCRLLSYYLGELRHHKELRPDVYPTPHDVQKGGYAQKEYQKYKLEEMRTLFRLFASEISELDRRMRFDHWVVLGTTENVRQFCEYLPQQISERVIHTSHAPVDAGDGEILERLQPFFGEHALHDEAAKLDLLRDRLRTRHFAIAGLRDTLEQLQEGKVETLVIARNLDSEGAQCTRCNFYLDRQSGDCPYCGGALRDGVDLVESMVRMAAEQDIDLRFVDTPPIQELDGAGALLKF